jgi:2-dehydro-3-deoxyphosphogluconate aldolase/(4S)-4-hydroxy-2-oxoglutarate aldolase
VAQFGKAEVLRRMEEVGLIPVFYEGDLEKARGVVSACSRGGAKVVEFVNRGDFAVEVFGALLQGARTSDPTLVLGAGSIVDAPTAAAYVNRGANFIVGPSFHAEVAEVCNRRGIPYLPGCATPTEMLQAQRAGADIVKVFPADLLGGPKFVKAVLGPCPWLRLMPTGGVSATEESIRAWVEAGVACMGIGSNLITKDLVGARDWQALEEKVREALALVERVRREKTAKK